MSRSAAQIKSQQAYDKRRRSERSKSRLQVQFKTEQEKLEIVGDISDAGLTAVAILREWQKNYRESLKKA